MAALALILASPMNGRLEMSVFELKWFELQ